MLFSIVMLLAAPIQAAEIEPEGTALRKLQRGFLNMVLSPFELSHELHQEKREDIFPPSWFRGVGRGMLFMAGRATVGLVEVGTFFLPVPENYEPMIYPEFPWELLEEPEEVSEVMASEIVASDASEEDREDVMAQAAKKFELTDAGFDAELAEQLEL